MRQFFTSPRLENVERVEQMFEEAGIQTRVTDRATWNRATKRDFSYTDRRSTTRWPAVWVVKADDYSRARQMLREIGLMDSTRDVAPSYVPDEAPPPLAADPRARAVNRTRLLLLVAVVVGALVMSLRLFGVF
jgi:hypothetical protein